MGLTRSYGFPSQAAVRRLLIRSKAIRTRLQSPVLSLVPPNKNPDDEQAGADQDVDDTFKIQVFQDSHFGKADAKIWPTDCIVG